MPLALNDAVKEVMKLINETFPKTITSITNLADMILSSKGYTVLTASEGNEALEKFKSHKNKLLLVLSDHGLPGRNGNEILREIRSLVPEMKFILATGFIEPEERSEISGMGCRKLYRSHTAQRSWSRLYDRRSIRKPRKDQK